MGSTAHATAGPGRPSPATYERRRPETTVLHRVLSTHWPAFIEHVEAQGRGGGGRRVHKPNHDLSNADEHRGRMAGTADASWMPRGRGTSYSRMRSSSPPPKHRR